MSSKSGSATMRLPTVTEIEPATDFMSLPEASTKIVRVNDHFAVKMGHGVSLIEAENMKFLAAYSKVPVPKVHAAFRDPATNKAYFIMQCVPGETLEAILPSLNMARRAIVCKVLKDAITELRTLPPPDSLGMLNRTPCLDGVFWIRGLTESEPYINLVRNMVNQTLKNHRTVFAHDWEGAGWYPDFWDSCNATIACRFKPDWLELVPGILEQYPVEFLMMQVVYSSVFY
ncbi:kinase-like protein [Aspergillus stella-maris]|uniref:kinase-like protein n=1 Tax=Aspergillus stella-maris TaxID=1810926 RepID=UPI003CCCB905